MKKTIYLVLTAILMGCAAVYAANPTEQQHLFCDFESAADLPASQFHAPSGGGTVEIVADPVNALNHCLKVVTPSGENWGGCIFNEISLGETFMNTLYGISNNKVIGYDYVTMNIYRLDNTHVAQLKTVDVDDDGHTDAPSYLDLKPHAVQWDENYVANNKIKTGEWQEYGFNITHCHNSGISFIYIMPDREGSSTVYIDDIKFIKDLEKPVMGTATCGTSSAGSISLNVTASDNISNPVNHYMVSQNGSLASATDILAENGVLTVYGLDANKEYTFTIWAKDYAGNISDNSVTVTCSTSNAPSANFCRQPMTASGHTIYVSCEKTAANAYRLTIESDEAMSGLGGSFCHVNGSEAYQLNASGHFTLSDDKKKITCDITSTTAPDFYTPLYVLMPGEVIFTAPTGIVWGTCASAEPCEAPSGGQIAWPNLIYSEGATPWFIEFDSPCTGTNLHYQWYTNTTGVISDTDTPYTGPGYNTPYCKPSTVATGQRVYYYCKIWNDCGTIYSDMATVDIVDCTLSTINMSAPSTVTEGNSLTLTMNYPESNGGLKTVYWYKDGTLIATQGLPTDSIHNISRLTINPCALGDAGCYYCKVQDGSHCTKQSNTICVTVNPGTTPTPTVINHPQIEVCVGESVTLTGGATGPWSWSSGEITSSITVTGTAVETKTYTCTTATQIDNYTIKFKDCTPPTPEPCQELIYCKWNDVLFINNADSIFVAYQWYRDGQKLEGETRQFYYTHGESMSGDGHEYSAYAFKADGSSVEACAKAFSAFTRSADQNPGERRNVQVYPNPVQRNVPVRIIGLGEQPSLMVYSATGQRVAEYSGDTFVPNLPAGCYLLYATDGENEPYCQTLIVQ